MDTTYVNPAMFEDAEWSTFDEQVEFTGEIHFDYNDQCVSLTCICGRHLEIFDHSKTTCPKCGRVLELKTTVMIGWNPQEDEVIK